MGPLASLTILSLSMGVSTFLFGMLPLTLRLSRLTLRLLEVGGAGLLLGAACSVVLPEGAGTIFREESEGAGGEGHDHSGHVHSSGLAGVEPENLLAVSFLTGVLVMFVIDQIMAPGSHSHSHDCQHDEERSAGPGSAISSSSQHASRRRSHSGPHQHPTHDPSRPIHRLTRPESLVLMRSSSVVAAKGLEEAMKQNTSHGLSRFDGLPVSPTDAATLGPVIESPNHSGFSTTDRSPPPSPHRRPSRGGRGISSHSGNGGGAGGGGVGGGGLGLSPSRGLRRAFTSIAGLIIHAACDGIAMGASSASKDEGLKLVVVGAIMIHKAPAAFGLCSLLLSQRLSRSDIRRAMGIFSLATPLGALTTYLLLSIFFTTEPSSAALTSDPTFTAAHGHGGGGGGISAKHVGTALTFSAGSFLFVALDAVHELASHSADVHTVHLPIGSVAGAGVSHQGSGGEAGEESEEEAEDGDERRSGVRTTIAVERQTLGRTGRILVLLVGAVLPRSLQMLFGHGH